MSRCASVKLPEVSDWLSRSSELKTPEVSCGLASPPNSVAVAPPVVATVCAVMGVLDWPGQARRFRNAGGEGRIGRRICF